jgi:putative ribosome biogenesis GTPase RsgA
MSSFTQIGELMLKKIENAKLDELFGLLKDTKSKFSINDVENYFIYIFFEKITRIIHVKKTEHLHSKMQENVSKDKGEIVKVLFNIPYNISFITHESMETFERNASIENRYSKLNSIINYSVLLLREIEYN